MAMVPSLQRPSRENCVRMEQVGPSFTISVPKVSCGHDYCHVRVLVA